jgi:hypothetical protein
METKQKAISKLEKPKVPLPCSLKKSNFHSNKNNPLNVNSKIQNAKLFQTSNFHLKHDKLLQLYRKIK